MDRDPQSLTEDLRAYDDVVLALDPQHYWKLLETSSTFADSGYGNKALTVTGAPTRGVATGLTDILGVTFAPESSLAAATPLPATTTTFSILVLIKPLHDYVDAVGLIFGSEPFGDATGLQLTHATRQVTWTTVTGSNFSAGLILPKRQTSLVGLVVTAGVPQWSLNGVPYDTDAASVITTIVTQTPDIFGSNVANTTELRATVSRFAYFPGVALTEAEVAAVWSARFSCHTQTLAVVNRALAHLGQSRALTSVSADTTPAGVAARLHYNTAVDAILRAWAWPFANRYAALTLVGGTSATAVNSDWQYSYRTPDRLLRAIRVIQPGTKRAHDPNAPPFRVEQDALGSLLFTDQEDAELEYTVRPTCVALQGDVLFREAVSWYLASLLVPTLSKHEETVQFCLAMADATVKRAQASAANEEEPQNTNRNDPDWITGR